MAVDIDGAYRQFAPMVYRRCKHLLGDEEEALDAMQEVFVELLKLDGEVRSPSSFLYVVATRRCLNRIRARKRRPEDPAGQLLYEIASAGGGAGRSQARFLLGKLFGQNLESTRVIAALHYLDGLTLEEVAEEVGLSVSGVRRRLRILRKELKELEVQP